MGNEETESRALVPIEEVEAELVFAHGESQLIGYGSRKIVRESIRDQLRKGYKCFDYSVIEIENEKLTKSESNALAVVNVLLDGIYSKKTIAKKTRLSEAQVGFVLNALRAFGFVEIIKIRKTFYYKICVNE
ncbi:MAG TPA: hypothetical protein VGL27_17335 [Negativicutes bacterium]|jgi:hypothetical protein